MLIILALGIFCVHSFLEKSKSAALHHLVGQLTWQHLCFADPLKDPKTFKLDDDADP